MPRVRITSATATSDAQQGTRRLPAGTVLEVDDETAKRWVRNGIAEDTKLPVGNVSDAEAGASVEDIDAEIARLQRIKEGLVQSPVPEQVAPPSPYAGSEHPLAGYGLTEKQRVNLERAGFTRPDLIEQATDAELLEVDGIGEGALAKLRGKA